MLVAVDWASLVGANYIRFTEEKTKSQIPNTGDCDGGNVDGGGYDN
jgi:hypothetical protein